jgi:hypothetical protein
MASEACTSSAADLTGVEVPSPDTIRASADEKVKRGEGLTLLIPDRLPPPKLDRDTDALSWLQAVVEASKSSAGVQDLRDAYLPLLVFIVEIEDDEASGRSDTGAYSDRELAGVGELHDVAGRRLYLKQSDIKALVPGTR